MILLLDLAQKIKIIICFFFRQPHDSFESREKKAAERVMD